MLNPMRLDGNNIIVTGAGQGIGEQIARLVVALGAKAILIDVKGDKVKALSEELGSACTEWYVGSVSDPNFVRAAMIQKMSVDSWQQVIDVNLSGVFYCLQAVGRHMLERVEDGDMGQASIVNISSDAGRRGTIGQINYGAAKSGVMGITMSAAREWGSKGIRVNSICFGVIETEMTETIRSEKFRERIMSQVPMGRFASPQEVSQPVCFLLSQAASYITGQHLSVNGGYTIGV